MKTFTCIEAGTEKQSSNHNNYNAPKVNAVRLRWMTALNKSTSHILYGTEYYFMHMERKRVKNGNSKCHKRNQLHENSSKEHKNATEFHLFAWWACHFMQFVVLLFELHSMLAGFAIDRLFVIAFILIFVAVFYARCAMCVFDLRLMIISPKHEINILFIQ